MYRDVNREGSRWRRHALIEETVGDASHGFKHRGISICILATTIKSVEDAERREHVEHDGPVAWGRGDGVVDKIELEEFAHAFKRLEMHGQGHLVGSKHQSLQVNRVSQIRQILPFDRVKHQIQSDQSRQNWEVRQRKNLAVVQGQHLKVTKVLQHRGNRFGEAPSKPHRYYINYVHEVSWSALSLFSDNFGKSNRLCLFGRNRPISAHHDILILGNPEWIQSGIQQSKISENRVNTDQREWLSFLLLWIRTDSKIDLLREISSAALLKLEYSFLRLTRCSRSSTWAFWSNFPIDFVDACATVSLLFRSTLALRRRSTRPLRFISIRYFLDSLCFLAPSAGEAGCSDLVTYFIVELSRLLAQLNN